MSRSLSLLIGLIAFLNLAGASFAAGEIGLVDNLRIMEEYPRAQQAQKQVLDLKKDLDELFNSLRTKLQDELQDSKISEADKLKKQKEAQDKFVAEKKKFDDKVESLRAEIDSKIETAINDEAKAQNLGLVLTKSAAYYGGKDITDQVLTRLKK
ncbi:MAG: OmpH family outer membrane protein [Candidatus Caenarcaniphilales bacterium]|nr:OmpH family outer membrane protein [Candidatus Caenarcaniphilales bacterium]